MGHNVALVLVSLLLVLVLAGPIFVTITGSFHFVEDHHSSERITL